MGLRPLLWPKPRRTRGPVNLDPSGGVHLVNGLGVAAAIPPRRVPEGGR